MKSKKLLKLVGTAVCVMALMPLGAALPANPVHAEILGDVLCHSNLLSIESETIDGITWKAYVFDDGVMITLDDASTLTGTVNVPETVNGYEINEIGLNIFKGCSATEICLPDSIQIIQGDSFWQCPNLKKVSMGKNVFFIEAAAFRSCPNLEEIQVSPENKQIHCDEQSLFQGTKLYYHFQGVHNKSYTIPEGTTQIKDLAFGSSTYLENVVIPDSVTQIGEVAFNNCTSLTSVSVSDSITVFPFGIFQNCRSLKNIKFPANLKQIGYDAFWNCTSLTNVCLPDKLEEIVPHAFYNCTSLKSIYIPASVNSIYDTAFKGCTALTNIVISPENETFAGMDGIPYNKLEFGPM